MYNTARVLLTILEWWNSLSMLRDISSMTLIWSFMALSRCISSVLDSRMLSLGIRATEILKQNQTKYSRCYREQTHSTKLLFANQHDQSIAYEALLSNVCLQTTLIKVSLANPCYQTITCKPVNQNYHSTA